MGSGARKHITQAMGAMITHTLTNVDHGDDELFAPTAIKFGDSCTCAVTVEAMHLNTITAANNWRGSVKKDEEVYA